MSDLAAACRRMWHDFALAWRDLACFLADGVRRVASDLAADARYLWAKVSGHE